jgi:hypothetical protein
MPIKYIFVKQKGIFVICQKLTTEYLHPLRLRKLIHGFQ